MADRRYRAFETVDGAPSAVPVAVGKSTCAVTRAHPMSSPATGFKVRFFNVKIATDLVWTPRSIGKRFTVARLALRTWSMQAGITVK